MPEETDARQVVLAIRPRFASAILDGSKTYELRKRLPKGLRSGDLVYLYETAPTSAMVGAFTIADVLPISPDDAWEQVGQGFAISKTEFDTYVNGAKQVVALKVDERFRLRESLSHNALASIDASFSPPRSARLIRSLELANLLRELVEPIET